MALKKEVLIVFLILLVSASVLAQSANVPQNVESYIKDFLEDSGVSDNSVVQDIKEVDQSSLPKDIDIGSVDEDNNVGIYEVDFTEEGETKNVFVVTYSTSGFTQQSESILTQNIQNMYFGFQGESNQSGFLESSSGVLLSEETGNVMLRSGSITGISSSLSLSGDGGVYIEVYKNGEDTGFYNFVSTEDDKKLDFDLQSEEIVTYEPGDTISVYVKVSGDVVWGGVVTAVETTG